MSSLERPVGHVFSRDEIRAMTVPEFEANQQAITEAMLAGKIAGPEQPPNVKSVS